MSFIIYHSDGEHYTRVCTVKLTGTDGVLAKFLTRHSHEETPFTWQLSDANIIQLARPDLDPDSHRLVFDMTPGSSHEVSLYRVSHIQGASDLDESDVVLASRILYQTSRLGQADALKRAFSLEQPESTRQMLEALRLTGGTMNGKYFWAKPKMDIGAAVCPSLMSSKTKNPKLIET